MRIKLLIILVLCSALLIAVEIPKLNDVPMISVGVSGYVEAPGTYLFTPVSRLSDVIAQQQALIPENHIETAETPLLEDERLSHYGPSDHRDQTKSLLKVDPAKQALRTISITREGKTTVYDLLKFYRLGDSSQNPLLKDGDLVLIKAVSEVVNISGAINIPGEMEYVAGDRLSDLLGLAAGYTYDADTQKIQLYRYQANRIDFEIIPLDIAAANYALQPYDRIIIPQTLEISRKLKVIISGQVKSPGEYIIGDNSTLYQVLMQAGGLSSRADINNLICYNEYLSEGDSALLENLSRRAMNDMTPLEYSYLRTNLQQLKGKYSLDPAKMWASQGKEADLELHDGDRIYVPEKMDLVWVSGQVRQPGLIPWVEGASWDYYIGEAGGYVNNRKVGKGRLIKSSSGNWVKPKKDIKIMPGDTVFVPEQTDRSLWTDVKDIVTLVSSAITIIVGVDAITK
ncbi:MAG: SLBB domain-containing protein [Candidatus Cloacimonetes bacterium]|nr:SLBB domain-containing protein [Candidatus Cloacimonadota bacterium]